ADHGGERSAAWELARASACRRWPTTAAGSLRAAAVRQRSSRPTLSVQETASCAPLACARSATRETRPVCGRSARPSSAFEALPSSGVGYSSKPPVQVVRRDQGETEGSTPRHRKTNGPGADVNLRVRACLDFDTTPESD